MMKIEVKLAAPDEAYIIKTYILFICTIYLGITDICRTAMVFTRIITIVEH
ncbi:hypothetical protein [Paenibacillus sp. 2TAB26]|uniref:hypothetical protein n=1 Tax=Paenibacillus sp. 2TAB26 TaxID=3233005 RepID=UPI003F9A6051